MVNYIGKTPLKKGFYKNFDDGKDRIIMVGTSGLTIMKGVLL